ncbi:sugar ABC transporter substrate-binding protein [Agromyces sp. H3Y2-19a]|uniref:ABC transporter substrate-binding protein n=1 Tax=Agromyces TaxID=33877 RepID=UPI001E611113|nr:MULTISPECIES: sugar ABC transporter substrate-binding protein [Agromyces]MCD5348056.1 sugar ABC transporter substrate-binding protein [Agromyces sp. S2-1-8]MDF0514345.1 sugar ABC transporter substrate-binding protein [Agromyces chromiiresistens]
MKNTTKRLWKRAGVVAGTGALLVGALSGCAAGASGDESTDIEAALDTETTLTWWTWGDTTQAWADAFMKEHPKITIEVVKVDNPDAAVTKLQNAVKAGSGAPDIIPVEYQTLPQLTLGDALADLTPYGLADNEDEFTASTWNAVNVQGELVGLPLDSGPMVMIYNTDLYQKAGVAEAPKTWDEFAAASAKIHAYDPEAYIANAGDAGFFTSMIWSFGGQPFKTDGENVTIDLQDEGSKQFADFWGGMLEKGELSQVPTWSDEWNRALAAGKLGTLMMGAWEIGGPTDAGDTWKVAPMPSADGQPASAENGGSAIAVTEQSKHKAAAAAVLQWLATGEGRDLVNQGGFPSTTATMSDPEWLGRTWPEVYGDQTANEVGAAAAESVIPGWQYLPYQGYANSVFGDSVGKALASESDLNAALLEWQDTLVEYGNSQGFTVNE